MSDTPRTDALRKQIQNPSAVQELLAICADFERELAEARRCLREAMTYCETRSTRGENVGSQVNENEYLRWVAQR